MPIVVTYAEGAISYSGSGSFIAGDIGDGGTLGYVGSGFPTFGTEISGLTGGFGGFDVRVVTTMSMFGTDTFTFDVQIPFGTIAQADLISVDPGIGGFLPMTGVSATSFGGGGNTFWTWNFPTGFALYVDTVTYNVSWVA